MEEQKPKVGLGVMIFKDKKVLLGKRKGSHGAGEYAWPGGHLEFGESFEACAKREVEEETGMEITNVCFLRLMNLKRYTGKHYVDIGLIADWKSGEPKLMEPDKCEGWGWYDIDNLPKPLFEPVTSYIEAYKTGKNYFDY
jgi:8-oxo-dGTP diphosphatase